MEKLKAFGAGLFFLALSGCAFFVSLRALSHHFTTGELPIVPARRSVGRWLEAMAEPFTLGYFLSLFAYMLFLLIGVGCLKIAFDDFGLTKKYDLRAHRVYILLSIVSIGFVAPIFVSLSRP